MTRIQQTGLSEDQTGLLLNREVLLTEVVLLADLSLPSRPLPKLPLGEPPPARAARLTWLSTQVRVKALRLEHDEQRAPAQEDCREEEVFQHCCAGHPPAAPMGCGQGGRHGAARRPGSGFGSGSAATCTQTSASAAGAAQPVRPTRAAAAARGLVTAPRPRR